MTPLFMIILCLFTVTPAFAKKADMFEDQGIAVQNRPYVDSDRYYGWRTQPDVNLRSREGSLWGNGLPSGKRWTGSAGLSQLQLFFTQARCFGPDLLDLVE